MTLKHFMRRSVDGVTVRLGRALRTRSLPCYFNRKWLKLTRESWSTIYSNYEPYMARALEKNLHEGDVFMDVGAHFGLWSSYAAKIVGKRGKIIAFEPSAVFEVLRENAAIAHRVEPLKLGVGAQDREATFFGHGNATTGSFVEAVTNMGVKHQPAVPVTGYQVKVRSLDSVVAELKVRPTLIKVDVEGFELEVLRGAEKLIRETHPSWLIEIHPRQLHLSGSSEESLLAHLKLSGYSLEVIDRNPNSIYTVLAQAA